MRYSQDTLEHFGIELNGNYYNYHLEYPPRIVGESVYYDRIVRSRATEEHLKTHDKAIKTLSPSRDNLPAMWNHELPPLYTPNYAELRDAIERNGGVLYLCEGDKDLWSLYEVGFHNAASMISAGFSDKRRRAIEQLGVRHLVIFPDLDKAGLASASTAQSSLTSTKVTIRLLPMYANGVRVKDITDVLEAFDFDVSSAHDVLVNQSSIWRDSHTYKDKVFQKSITDIASRIISDLGFDDFDTNGFSRTMVACPMKEHEHDDVSPAAAWNKDGNFLYCQKCGETYLTIDVAKQLGYNLSSFYDEYETSKQKQETVEHAVKDYYRTSIHTGFDNAVKKYKEQSLSQHMFSLDDAIENYQLRSKGLITSKYPPVPFPLPALHTIGGNAELLMRPTLVALLGASGTYKTTLMFTMAIQMLTWGYNGFFWTPEWSFEKIGDRLIQNFGGLNMTESRRLERYYYEQGNETLYEFGQIPDDNRMYDNIIAQRRIDEYIKGKLHFPKQSASISELYGSLAAGLDELIEANIEPHFVMVDYVQLVQSPSFIREGWTHEETISVFSQIAKDYGLVIFIASQAKKSEAEAAIKNKEPLLSQSGHFVSDWQFKLYLSVLPVERVVVRGKEFHSIKMFVPKNNDGKAIRSYDDGINLYVDLERLVVVDPLSPPKHFYDKFDS